jgi:hypothetical protein
MNVISFFWETNEEGQEILSVFLNAVRTDPRSGHTNSFSIRFSKAIGEKFVEHMEDFLRYLVAAPLNHASNTGSAKPKNRRAVDAEIVEEDTTNIAPTGEWVPQ